jgi:hypothetical protein
MSAGFFERRENFRALGQKHVLPILILHKVFLLYFIQNSIESIHKVAPLWKPFIRTFHILC